MSVCISFDFSATCVQRITLNEEAIKFNINDDNVLDFIKNGKVLTTVFGKELLFVSEDICSTIGFVEQIDHDNVEIDYFEIKKVEIL